MTKSTAVLSTTIQAVTETAPVVAPPVVPVVPVAVAPSTRPAIIVIADRIGLAFDMAAVHIRAGYAMSPDNPPEVFASMGQAIITLVVGNPSAAAIEAAEASTAYAINLQRTAYDLEVANAIRLTAEDLARRVKKAELAAQVVEAEKALRKLKATAAAA